MNNININDLSQLLLGIGSNKLIIIAGLILGLVFLLKPILKDIISIIIDKRKTIKVKIIMEENYDTGEKTFK